MKFIPERSECDKWMRSTTSIKYNEYRYGGLTASVYSYSLFDNASVYSYSLFDKINFELDKLSICIWPIDKNRRVAIWMKIA